MLVLDLINVSNALEREIIYCSSRINQFTNTTLPSPQKEPLKSSVSKE